MEFIFISNSFVPSKAANTISSIKMCEKIAQNDFDVTLICKDNSSRPQIDLKDIYKYYNIKTQFKIKKIKIYGINFLDYFLYSLKIILFYFRSKNSFFYCKDIFTFFLLYLMKKKYLSIELHHSFEGSRGRIFLKLVNFNKIKVIVISKALKNFYLKNYKIPDKNILVAHDGADLHKIHKHANSFYTLKNISVGYVGSLNYGKGIELVIKIAKKLPKIKFHIMGGNNKEILRFSTNKPKNLIFHGHIYHNKLNQYFDMFHIALLPNQDKIFVRGSKTNISKWTSPLKMFEYMSSKKIIIASDHEVLKEILTDQITCFFCNPNNASEWIKKIQYIIDNPNIVSKIVDNAYDILSEKYTWNKRAKNIINFIYE